VKIEKLLCSTAPYLKGDGSKHGFLFSFKKNFFFFRINEIKRKKDKEKEKRRSVALIIYLLN